MDAEFHYYMTYLIAARAGFGPDDAITIAYASQHVDDNTVRFEIDKGLPTAYRNYISQTMNILKPKANLFRIYPVFHFIPGDPWAETAWRRDGRLHWLNTTPGSDNAEKIFRAALATESPYRIGIAAHAYADTWAHQNFTGYYEPFNAMSDNPLKKVTPNIGHADAAHAPDWPALVWQDSRLKERRVDNKLRFLQAADSMLARFSQVTDRSLSEAALLERRAALRRDLDWAIGERDDRNAWREERVGRYRELASRKDYGSRDLEAYDPDLWFEACVNEDVRGLRNRSNFFFARIDPIHDQYTWKDRETLLDSHWHRFQQAVKAHQDQALGTLKEKNLSFLDLPEW